MAAPTEPDSVATDPGGTGTNITAVLSTHQANDFLLVYVTNTGNALWAGNPAGWTRIDQKQVGTSGTGLLGTLFVRRVLSGDSLPLANPTFTLGATVTRHAVCVTVRGASLEGIFTVPAYGARAFTTGTANPVRPAALTTLAPEMRVIHFYGSRAATTAPDPSGYTQLEEIITSGTLVTNASSKVVADQNTSLTNQDASPISGVRWVSALVCIPSADYPYYRSGSQATTASGTSVTPALPAGSTATDVNGRKDVIIASVEGAGSTTLAPASGAWTAIPSPWQGTTSGGGSTVGKWWAYADAALNRQFTRTGTGEISACFTTYYNCHQTNPIGAIDADARTSSTTSTWDAITRLYAQALVQATCVADGTPTFTAAAGWTERMDGLGICCADQIYNAVGSAASAAFTLSAASPTLVGLVEIRNPTDPPTQLPAPRTMLMMRRRRA